MQKDNMNHAMPETGARLYPEIYGMLAPIVEQLIAEMENYGEIYLTDELLYEMIDEAIRRAGLEFDVELHTADDEFHEVSISMEEREEAVPVLYQFGRSTGGQQHGGHGHQGHNNRRNSHSHNHNHHNHNNRHRPDNRRHHRHHNRDTASDILRILFLQQIFGGLRPNWYCR